MERFDYSRAATVDEALRRLSPAGSTVRPLAGGTDLVPLMKLHLVRPDHLVDIKRAAGLSGEITETDSELRIGALVTLAQLEASEPVRDRTPALAESAAAAATPQLRHMATIGGNLLQRPRCWYFRHADVPCWLKGGEDCPAREGENQLHALYHDGPCVAVHPSDPATALVALGAMVKILGVTGERSVALDEFLARPTASRRTESILAPEELISEIVVPLPAAGRSAFRKAMDRRTWAFALVSAAASLTFEGNRVATARIVLGGVDQVPHLATEAADVLVGQSLTQKSIAGAASAATAGARPLSKNAYKVALAEALVRQTLELLYPD